VNLGLTIDVLTRGHGSLLLDLWYVRVVANLRRTGERPACPRFQKTAWVGHPPAVPSISEWPNITCTYPSIDAGGRI